MKFREFLKENEQSVSLNGSPIIFYHGSNKKFDDFDFSKIGENFKSSKNGFYFINDKKFAKHFVKNDGQLIKANLIFENPLIVNDNFCDENNLPPIGFGDDDVVGWFDEHSDEIFDELKSHDSILVYDKRKKNHIILAIAFKKEQIKILGIEK